MGFRVWGLGLGEGGMTHRDGALTGRRGRLPHGGRFRVSGFGPANCSTHALMPWGKGATPRELTIEKPGKQRGIVNLAPNIDGARSDMPDRNHAAWSQGADAQGGCTGDVPGMHRDVGGSLTWLELIDVIP
jgi:hypothetical protein